MAILEGYSDIRSLKGSRAVRGTPTSSFKTAKRNVDTCLHITLVIPNGLQDLPRELTKFVCNDLQTY